MLNQPELLQPNPLDPRELQVFANIPETDQQAWLYFMQSSHQRERLGIAPMYTFDQFDGGIAPHIPGLIEFVDNTITKGLRPGQPLVPNYAEPAAVTLDGKEYVFDSMLDGFKSSAQAIERERQKGPIALLLPHSSLATPYLAARSLIEALGSEISEKIHIVVGPRPLVMSYEVYNSVTNIVQQISPVLFGRALAKLLMTGPDTDSVRNNPSLKYWLKEQRANFWANLDEIMEPDSTGNNIVIYCPAGRVAENGIEYQVDGNFNYLTRYPNLRVLPAGVYDQLLRDPENPESIVYINPDNILWRPTNDTHAEYLHERATYLSQSPLGALALESSTAHVIRLARSTLTRSR